MQEHSIRGTHYRTLEPIEIRFEDGIITDISAVSSDLLVSDQILAPGLIDIQVNGYNGINFSSLDLTEADILQVTQQLWCFGVTTYLPTVITSAPEVYQHSLTVLRDAVSHDDIKKSVAGIHMEGPYLSPEDGYRGAHNREWVKNPDWSEFQKYWLLSGNQIILVTLAPELPGALSFIARCQEHDIHVALGHHAAMGKTLEQAIQNGAELSTHLGNACANMIDRHNNVLWPQLADDRLYASLILDGFHLTAHEAKVFYRAKRADKVILVSDLTQYAGLAPGKYEWNGTILEVSDNGRLSLPELNVLAGAGTHLLNGIFNLQQYTGCNVSDAIDTATLNPARLLNLHDRGKLQVGRRADIIALRTGKQVPEIVKTILYGKTVHEI